MTTSHTLTVHLVDGTSLDVPTHRPGQTSEDVARALAERLKTGAALWAPSATADGDTLGAVVIPVAGIALVEVADYEAPVTPAADTSEADAVVATADHAAAVDADTATTAPAQPAAPAAESVPPAEPVM